MKAIFIAMILLSTLHADFVKNGNIVRDTDTSLEWQDDKVSDRMYQDDAIRECENLVLEGYDDWRLPNINELKTIVNYSVVNPAIASIFVNTTSEYYWSSTTKSSYKAYAWSVDFYDGTVLTRAKSFLYNVRCVRGGE